MARKASALRTARTPASKPQAKLPRTAAEWTIMLVKLTSALANWESASAVVEERIEATDGMAASLRKESFLVRLPITWFFISLSALSLEFGSGESSRVRRSTGPWIGTVAAAVGMVVIGSGGGRIGMA